MSDRISLNGTWELRWLDGQRGGDVERVLGTNPDQRLAMQARVPGEVHLDLARAGIIDEPNDGLSVLQARWVEECIWLFRRAFAAPPLARGERAFLTLEALDLAATIYVNGQEAGRHANSFYPCRLDVTDKLVKGENVVVVSIDSGLYYAGDKPASGYASTPAGLLHRRHWLRQMQGGFGWDFAPRLLNVGIRGAVFLEICRSVQVEDFAATAVVSDDLSEGRVTVRVHVNGIATQAVAGTLAATAAGATASAAVEIQPGPQCLKLSLRVSQPELWWPAGHGAQRLYDLHATLSVGEQEFRLTRKIGFRRVEVDQSPHPAGGRYFIIRVNNKPIFCKGSNLAPADLIRSRLDRCRYEMLVDRAREAHLNFLRINGVGLYESDDFYELCDQHGILLWQEFTFACAKYPIHDENFLGDVRREAAYQVRRLASHPSLIVWCGSNELEWGAWDWGYDKGVAYADYALYHLVLPRIVREEDGTRFYQPGSPFSPDGQHPNRDDMGDQHPWGLGMANTDFRGYRTWTCRFADEGGFLGPTPVPTVQACLQGAAGHPMDAGDSPAASFAFEYHDNSFSSHGKDRRQQDIFVQDFLGKSVAGMGVEDFVYWVGLLQGEALSEYARNFRRRMFDCAAAVNWSFNETWPSTRGWSIVDYFGRRMPSFYPYRRALAPVIVVVAVEGECVCVLGVNDGPELTADLRYGLFSLAGEYPLNHRRTVRLAGNASTVLAELPLAAWKDAGETTHGAFALLTRDGNELARDRLFLPFFKDLAWRRAEVRARREGSKAIFESDVFAWRVCLDLDGREMPDNFFDLLPGIPTALDWPGRLGEPQVVRVGNLAPDR